MPELPEVETIVRELRATAVGKKFWDLESKLDSTFTPSPQLILNQIRGVRILDVVRRAKFIVFILDQRLRLVIHLRMTGRLLWKKPRKSTEKHVRAVFIFSNATSLIFSDTRKFGHIWFGTDKDIDHITGMDKLGPEPLDMSEEDFCLLMGMTKGILKNSLLRQDLISGIGNIYADEICHRLGVNPSSRLEKLGARKMSELYYAVQYCLQQGIEHCGVSMSDFVGTRGTLGKHQKYLKVYGRTGDECYTCGTIIKKTRVAGRGTFYCPVCQPLIR